MMALMVWLLALILPWAYILPPDRVLDQVIQARSSAVPVSLRLALDGVDPTWPKEIRIDLHPVGGVRIDDLQGGRWVVRRGRVVAANQAQIPAWLPQLELLSFPTVDSLSLFLEDSGVDLLRSELARCGADDCFVIGGRDSSAQLWVEKDGFELRTWVVAFGKRFDLTRYRDWGKIRFPSKIEVLDGSGRLATLDVRTLEPAPQLSPNDFSDRWTRL